MTEITDQIRSALETCARRPDKMNFAALELMITAALADAQREGAEQMREAIAQQAEINALYGVHGTTVSTIRSMPLPDGSRAHGERHGTATPGQRAAQPEATDAITRALETCAKRPAAINRAALSCLVASAMADANGTATTGQRAAQLEAIDEFDAAERGER